MTENKQIFDTLNQIKLAKGILSRQSPNDINVNHQERKININNHPNQQLNQPNHTNQSNQTSTITTLNKSPIHLGTPTKSSIRTTSCTPNVSKTTKFRPPHESQSSNFVRGNRGQNISNTTKMPSGTKIIKCLNNIKGSNLNEITKSIENTNLAISTQYELKDKEKSNCYAKYTVYSSGSVEEYSYIEDQNKYFKEGMEDKGRSIDAFNNNKDDTLYCLFDGHGGDSVAIVLQKNYHSFFKKALTKSKTVEEALKNSFIDIDKELKALDLVNVGSTGCVVYITKEKGQTVIYCANIGDTRASLINLSTNEYKRLSYDHRATDPKERKRIINQGGMVLNGRVMGQLMLSRAFGDFELKSFGVRCEPYVSRISLGNDCNDQFYIIIASDGIWDIMSEKEIYKYLQSSTNTEEITEKILSRCFAKKAWDNLSCFAIKLKPTNS